MTDHALLSPSAAHRWMRCPASVVLEQDYPETSSEYADRGTMMHEAAARLLNGEDWLKITGLSHDEIDIVAEYVDRVKEAAQNGVLFVEERVDFSEEIGVPDSFGTADALIISGTRLEIHDLKTGRGVPVDAEDNEQLQLYALGALGAYELIYPIETVKLCIHQPPLDNFTEWEIPVEELRKFQRRVVDAAADVLTAMNAAGEVDTDFDQSEFSKSFARPSDKACRFCAAKAKCLALSAQVSEATAMDFDDLTDVPATADDLKTVTPDRLASLFARVGLVENWCKAIREAVFAELSAGRDVPGYKLVEGRKGARQWADAAAAEAALKGMRLKQDEMYEMKLISPATAEKRRKGGLIGDRQWSKLETLITQKDGGPSVAPADDPRPAISLAAKPEEFEALA